MVTWRPAQSAGMAMSRRSQTRAVGELPPDHWLISETMSLLGEAVAGVGRPEEAEPLLLDAYAGLKASEDTPRQSLTEAIGRLVRFYESRNDAEKAGKWRQTLHGGRK